MESVKHCINEFSLLPNAVDRRLEQEGLAVSWFWRLKLYDQVTNVVGQALGCRWPASYLRLLQSLLPMRRDGVVSSFS